MKFCKKCNADTERYKDGKCKPCVRARAARWLIENPEKAIAQAKKWRAENPEKAKKIAVKYRSTHSQECAESAKRRYESDLDRSRKLARERAARFRAENRKLASERSRKWAEENPEKTRVAEKKWRAANPEKCRLHSHNRRARQRTNGGNLSPDIIQRLMKLQRGKCACGCKQPLGDDYHLDHRMPLALGGEHADKNVQLLRGQCNLQKGSKHPVEFMQSRGFLL